MRNFQAFFAFGKRSTFSLSYNGREIIAFDSSSIEGQYDLGYELCTLVQGLAQWYSDNYIDLTLLQREVFRTLVCAHDFAEYQIEVFAELAEFSLAINRV